MGWGARILYITMRALLYTYIQYISWEIAVSPGGAESGRVPKSPHTVILRPESQEAQPTEWDEEIKKYIYIYTQKFYKRRPLIFFSFYVPMFNVTDDWFLLSETKRSTANENDNSRWKRKKMVFFFLFFGAIQTLAGKSGGRKRKKKNFADGHVWKEQQRNRIAIKRDWIMALHQITYVVDRIPFEGAELWNAIKKRQKK